jgi:hypothetical protein
MSAQRNPGELDRLIETGVGIVAEELNDSSQNVHLQNELEAFNNETRFLRTRSIVWGALLVLFVAGLAFVFTFEENLADWSWSGTLPRNPVLAAEKILAISPIFVRAFWILSRKCCRSSHGSQMENIGRAHRYILLFFSLGLRDHPVMPSLRPTCLGASFVFQQCVCNRPRVPNFGAC